MYGDKNLEFSVANRDAAKLITKSLPLGQGDLTGDTSGMGPYDGGLYIFVSAGEDVPAGLVITLQHSDSSNGAFSNLLTFPATSAVKPAGSVIVKQPVPPNIKNWVRFSLSSAVKLNIIFTPDVEKLVNGIVKE